MFIKNFYLSAALALGLAGCSDNKLEDIVLHADMNGDGKEDIIRLRRQEGLECDKGYEDYRKSPPGIYVLLGLGNSFVDGNPVYNLCEIQVYDASNLALIDPRVGKIEVVDYNTDGKLDLVFNPENREKHTLVFLNKYGDAMFWDARIVKQL